MRIRRNLKLFGPITLWCGILLSCQPGAVYHAFHSVSEAGWRQEDTLRFSFNLPDSTALYALSIELRHRLDFPYTELPVDMTLTTSTDSVIWRDTLVIPVTDVRGNWVGRGWGDLRTTCSPNIALPVGKKDTLQLLLLPAWTDSLLVGVNDIGVCIQSFAERP